MKTVTKTARYNVPPATLYGFLNKEENLPKWATAYCKTIKKSDDGYKIMTPAGELFLAYDCNEAAGTINIKTGPRKDMMWCWPTRVASDNGAGSLFIFTAVQMPDQPDTEFDGQMAALGKELENIRQIVEQ